MKDRLIGKISLFFLGVFIFTLLNRVLFGLGWGDLSVTLIAFAAGVAFVLLTGGKFSFNRKKRMSASLFFMMLALVSLVNLCAGYINQFMEYCFNLGGLTLKGADLALTGASAGVAAADYYVAFFVVPLLEELLYRAVGYNTLKKYAGNGTAAVLSAIAFGLSHGQFHRFLDTFLAGIILCIVYEECGIWASYAVHMMMNLGLGTIILLLGALVNDTVGYMTVVVYMIFIVIGLMIAHRKRDEVKAWLAERQVSWKTVGSGLITLGFVLLLVFSIYRMCSYVTPLG